MAFLDKPLGRVPVIGKKELDVLELKTLILLASEHRMTTSEILKIMDIDKVRRKSIIERLKKDPFLEFRNEVKPRDIKLKSAPLRDSVIKQSRVGKPGFMFSLNSDEFRKVSELEEKITPEMIEMIKDSGVIEPITEYIEKFILLNQDFLVQFHKEVNDLILEPYRENFINLPFDYPLEYVRGINHPSELG